MTTGTSISGAESGSSSSSFLLARWLFLRGLGLIHFVAFASYALQIVGLNGASGIEPTHEILQAASQHFGARAYYLMPTIEWLNSTDAALLALAWSGAFFSIFLTLGVCPAPTLALLALLWLSLITGGGEFTAFQSDGMLVEVTVLALFLAPWQWFEPPWKVPAGYLRQAAPTAVSLFLLRFMLFRLMLAAGLVKIESGDETWRMFTALNYHFETQPIPTPLAWYAHWLPAWMHKFSVGAMFFSETLAPILIFAGRYARLIAAASIASLHLMIAATGNYTLLNLLCVLLCVPLVDDAVVSHVMPGQLAERITAARAPGVTWRWSGLLQKTLAAPLIFLAASQFLCTACPSLLPDLVIDCVAAAAPFHLADRYGLFAVMTTTRPEIVFEGSRDGQNWRSYEFLYKPGDDLKRPPPWVEPHMPRLDWRLWFAAMRPVEDNPWVLRLVKHLLADNSMNQFFSQNPFPKEPPMFIRAFVYDYHFTLAAGQKCLPGQTVRQNFFEYL